MEAIDLTRIGYQQQKGEIREIILSNGRRIEVERNPERNGAIWDWRVEDQYFEHKGFAQAYLDRIIRESLTGKRIIFHAKRGVPEICGIDGTLCRAPGRCNTALCSNCPVAEEFFAKRDGVELIYAFGRDVE